MPVRNGLGCGLMVFLYHLGNGVRVGKCNE